MKHLMPAPCQLTAQLHLERMACEVVDENPHRLLLSPPLVLGVRRERPTVQRRAVLEYCTKRRWTRLRRVTAYNLHRGDTRSGR